MPGDLEPADAPARAAPDHRDDRVALAIATLVGERLAGRDGLNHEVWLASTVQEENGLIGASSLADEERFDRCIAMDVGLTGDIPGPDRRVFPTAWGRARCSSTRTAAPTT
ncbi:MAG: hypothetical protein H0U40_05985, partial [Chloroflexia bacterium]|nr:hypothetical protein [Chloroflexia bacterium]